MIKSLVIILLNVAIYFRTLKFEPVTDDIHRLRDLKRNGTIKQWSMRAIWAKLYGAGMFENNTRDRCVNPCLHTLASVLIYVIFGMTDVSFIAALLYSVSPTNNQTAVWLNGRRYLVNTILALIISASLPFGLILYPLISLFQINAMPVPLLLIFTDFWWLTPILGLAPFFYNNYMIKKLRSRIHHRMKCSSYFDYSPRKLILVVKTFGYYFFHIIFPQKVFFFSTFQQEFAITKQGNKKAYSIDFEFFKGAVALIITGTAFYLFPQVRYYIFWYLIFILPWLNWITITQMVADRYTAIASIGMYMTLATLLPTEIIAILIGYYIAKNIQVQDMYKDIDNFYLYHIWNVPDSVHGTLFYCRECMKSGLLYHAFVAVKRVLRFHPNNLRCLLNYARILNLLGHTKERDETIAQCWDAAADNLYKEPHEIRLDIQNIIYGNKVHITKEPKCESTPTTPKNKETS